MKGTNRGIRLLAGALAALLAAGGPIPLRAEERELRISTPEQLAELSARCTRDSYSAGLRVVLTEDIDLTDIELAPIPSFSGEFDGAGHRITGFSFTGSGSSQGLFRHLTPQAQVRRLTVEGELAPTGSQSALGLVAGRNEGLIEDCVAQGRVQGDQDVGGVAGINLETGVLRGCTSQAEVTGSRRTGGVAGRNQGLMKDCLNRGPVNPEPNESAMDTGGIAGRNEGSLINCQNLGAVGYTHTGYNTGGIAGMQKGRILSCRNTGPVLGRKDVGGIAGQFEPDVTELTGEDPLQELDGELSALSGLLKTFSTQLNDTVGDAADRMQEVNDAVTSLREGIRGGENGSPTLSAALDEAYLLLRSAREAGDTALSSARAAGRAMAAALEDVGDALGALRRLELPGLQPELDAAQDALEALEKDLEALNSALEKLQPLVSSLREYLSDGQLTRQELEALRTQLEAIGDTGAGAAGEQLLKDAAKLAGALGDLQKKLADQAGTGSSAAKEALDQLADAGRDLERASRLLEDAMGTNWLQSLRDAADILDQYLKPTPDTNRLADAGAQLDVIGEQVDQIASETGRSSDALNSTTNAVVDQMDQIRHTLNSLTDPPEITVDDVSDSAETAGDGVILSCENRGEILADSNAGGIVGAISLEIELNPEENLLDREDGEERAWLADRRTLLNARVDSCRNSGSVTARNTCAGGILGLGELGAVRNCVATGSGEVTDGDCCGGIAGLSRTVIRDSSALVRLTGSSSIGGIAGEGTDLYGCRAVADIEGEGERHGAIAGRADGVLEGNFYLREDLAGVDGVEYSGKAEGLAYEAFSTLEGLPPAFTVMTVTFRAEERAVQRISVEYGQPFPVEQIPGVPEKEGCDGVWEEFDRGPIRRSMEILAVYTPWAAAVSSGEAQPRLLAEGSFEDGTVLTLREWTPERLPGGYRLVDSLDFDLQYGTQEEPAAFVLRLRCREEGALRIGLWNGSGFTLVEPVRDGSYLVFPVEAPGPLAVLAPITPLWVWGLIGGGTGLLAITAAVLLRKKRRPKAKTSKGSALRASCQGD